MNEPLVFDPEFHVYTVGGEVIPSVTQLMQEFGIINTDFYDEVGKVRGSFVHHATELIDKGTLDWDELDPILSPYCQAYQKFIDETKFDIIFSELKGYSPTHWYAGTLDRFIHLNGRNVLFDIKTGSVQPWVTVQLAAYRNLLHLKGELIDVCCSLELRKDGTYRFNQISPIDLMDGWNDFEAMCRVLSAQKRYNPKAEA